jgi:hypothetical protein
LEGLESYDIGLNEIYADKFALNSDYILRRRPPDLFRAECKDEETCLLYAQLEEGNGSMDRRKNILPFGGKGEESSAGGAGAGGGGGTPSPTKKSPRKAPRPNPSPSSLPASSSSRTPPVIPGKAATSPRPRPTLEHIPSACSILNDDVVAEIKDVAELF